MNTVVGFVGSVLLFVVLVFGLSGCTQPDRATRTLETAGYTNVRTGGYGWFSCSEDDPFRTKFDATSPNGTEVSGVVCAGWFKGQTIRLD